MKIVHAGMTGDNWTALLQCPGCKLVMEIEAQDILGIRGSLVVPCPKDQCGIHIEVNEKVIPDFVKAKVVDVQIVQVKTAPSDLN